MEKRRMILYRGSLKSCNYQCGYCPFSKHPRSDRELLKDKEQWLRFCESLIERAGPLKIGAMMVVPYGEALLHPWYWEGLGRLAGTEGIEAVGAQTNLSFSVEKSLDIYIKAGGERQKLRLWATFHPQMTTVEVFAEKCRQLVKAGILMSVGAVGVPENRQVIKALRSSLPEEVYLWINKMDGLGKTYTQEEIEDFQAVDPYFIRELERVPSSPEVCGNRLFVEGDGKLRRCNISSVLAENWYGSWEDLFGKEGAGGHETVSCGKRLCSCYLAHGGRDEVMNQILFGPYPPFRIPRRPRAVFLDIDGLLIPKGESGVPGRTVTDLRALAADGCRLFFATTLPCKDARRRCREIWGLFSGGIFAGGAHVALWSDSEDTEQFFFLDRGLMTLLERQKERYGFRVLVYGDAATGNIYKITLVRPRNRGWREKEAAAIRALCAEEAKGNSARCLVEESCLQIVAAKASKANGVEQICGWLGISMGEAEAAGDSPEDEAMMRRVKENMRYI